MLVVNFSKNHELQGYGIHKAKVNQRIVLRYTCIEQIYDQRSELFIDLFLTIKTLNIFWQILKKYPSLR